jgi:hypothetical protein
MLIQTAVSGIRNIKEGDLKISLGTIDGILDNHKESKIKIKQKPRINTKQSNNTKNVTEPRSNNNESAVRAIISPNNPIFLSCRGRNLFSVKILYY